MDGNITLILGKNGAGKTTFLNKKFNSTQNSSHIEAQSENKANSIFRNMTIKTMLQGCKDLNYQINVQNFLNYFDIRNLMEQKFKNLSGGELKILNLAFQLSKLEKNIFIDELERDLSTKNIELLVDFINRNKNMANFFIITHDQGVFKKINHDQILFFNNYQKQNISNNVNWDKIWEN